MGELTAIEWATHTQNWWWGCKEKSAGCDNCYAHKLDNRWGGNAWGDLGERRITSAKVWNDPYRWNRQAEAHIDATGEYPRAFSLSMGDFLEDHPALAEPRKRAMGVIEDCTNLVWLILSKRPENAGLADNWAAGWPGHVWFGTSVENQEMADERIPLALNVPARVRFLSCEPLLGPVDLDQPHCQHHDRDDIVTDPAGREWCGYCVGDGSSGELSYGHWLTLDGIGWVICGGETQSRRPMHPAWARALRDQCADTDTPFFFKQWGDWAEAPSNYGPDVPERARANTELVFASDHGDVDGRIMLRVGKKRAGRLLDGREWNQLPPEAYAGSRAENTHA